MVTSPPPNGTKYIQQILNLNKQGKKEKKKHTTTTKQIPGRLRIMLVLQNLGISLYPDEICRQTDRVPGHCTIWGLFFELLWPAVVDKHLIWKDSLGIHRFNMSA